MEKVLHRHHAGVVWEQAYAIFSTGFSACIAKWTHFIGIVVKGIKSTHARTGSGFGWTLADGVYANVLFLTVVVTERTREIGVRKALGAKKSTIAFQFFIETLIIGQLGGVVGIILGILIGYGISSAID